MTTEMPKTFDFAEAEPRIYEHWQDSGYFKPEIHPDGEPFVISIPPPNVTGALHNGHAMFVSLEDLMIRYERMRGRAALWVPGSDHAGIATQLQVERMLRDEGTSRKEVGREEFLRRTWEWKRKYGGRIVQQLRRLGASCDWDRERFTLDNGLSRAVREAFVTLWEQGLIYRGLRLINWSPGLQTAVSDLEVEREEEEGFLYYFNYPVEGGGEIPVATTRPETILGDTAVAVHPDDERFRAYVGRYALVPMLNRRIPIIADEYVDRAFGTGALKITPAHDPNDYEIGQRHESGRDQHHEPGRHAQRECRAICRAGSFRRSQKPVGRYGNSGHDHQSAALSPCRTPFTARRRDRGANGQHAVVRENSAAGRKGDGCCARRSDRDRAGSLR